MARDGKRNLDSMNQRIMRVFFGAEACNYTSKWSKWPEPQKSIYSRMFKNGFVLSKHSEIKKLKSTVEKLNETLDNV